MSQIRNRLNSFKLLYAGVTYPSGLCLSLDIANFAKLLKMLDLMGETKQLIL